MKALEPSASQG